VPNFLILQPIKTDVIVTACNAETHPFMDW
jgi:hypothetical protein